MQLTDIPVVAFAPLCSRHPDAAERLSSRRTRLFEMSNLSHMLRGMGKLEPHPLAVPAGRKTASLDHRDLVRHLRMRGIVGDHVNAGLWDDFTRPVFLRHD